MDIAIDTSGKVWMVGQGLATELNGVQLSIHTLTPDQEAALKALREDREYTTFDGTSFAAVGTVERIER
jgi:hypothetical protein